MKKAVLATTGKETHRRLTILADYIETVPDDRLDQSVYVEPSLSKGDVLPPAHVKCGTSACAAGHATCIEEFQKLGLYLDYYPRSLSWMPALRGLHGNAVESLIDFFGITLSEVAFLFGETPCTPKEKAADIRYIAERYE